MFHQTNKFLVITIRKIRLLPKLRNLEDTVNTVSSRVLIGLKQCLDVGTIHEGMNVMVAGFGVGLGWSGIMLKF